MEYKKTLLLVPSAYNIKALGDVVNFVDFYKDDLNIYILVRDIEKEVIDCVGYKLVDVDSSFGKYLRVTADFVIDAGSMNNSQKKGKNQIFVSIWHGIPYKKIMKDEPNMTPSTLTAYTNAYDYMISSSPYYTNTFLKKAMLYKGEILELGSSRMDSLFNKTSDDIKNLKIKLGIDPKKKVVLYAPTYRERGKVTIPFDLNKLGNSFFEEHVIVTKLHYLNDLEKKNSKIIDLTSYENISDILLCTDLLISDYSSVIFDFSVLNKPIILYQYDKENYEKERGLYFDIREYINEDSLVFNESDLINRLKNIDFDICNHTLKNEFYPYENGESTSKIVKELDFDLSKRKTKDLVFLINQKNEIGGIHTFVNNMSKYYKTKYNSRIFVLAVKEFAIWNSKIHLYDFKYADFVISSEYQKATCSLILKNADSYIISTQLWAQEHFQKNIINGNCVVMFHDDPQLLIEAKKFPNHLKSMNDFTIYNYRRYLMLTELSATKIKPHLVGAVQNALGYIRNSVDLTYNKLSIPVSNEWAFVGRLDDQKNPFELIKLGLIIKAKKANAVINVYGDGPLRQEIFNKIKEHNLEKIIILHGFVSDKREIYEKNKGLLLVSKHEGFGLVILEAYSFGRPVIVYDTFTAAKEVVENNATGFLLEKDDVEGIYNIISGTVKVDEKAIEKKLMEFSNDAVFDDWNKILESLKDYPVIKMKDEQKSYIDKCFRVFKKIEPKKRLVKFIKVVNNDLLISYRNKKRRRQNLLKINTYSKKSISIIVPCYNGSKYVKNLVNSVIMQGIEDYEILLIDDGSEVEDLIITREIVESYSNDNVNIILYEKTNTGPGLTRNYGIERATKDFVLFLDVDDVLHENALTNMLVNITETNSDVVSGVTVRKKVSDKIKGYNKLEKWYPNLYKKNYISDNIMNRDDIYKDTLSTNKFYRRDVFEKYHLYFETGLYEDKVFTSKLYSRVPKISIIKDVIYYWMVYGANNSITTSKSVDNFLARMNAINSSWANYPDYVKFKMMCHFVRHDLMIYIREFNNYTKQDKTLMYDKSLAFIENGYQYVYPTMFGNDNVAKYILNVLLMHQFEDFIIIGDYISKKYYEGFEDMEK